MSFRIDFELFSTVSILTKQEGAALGNLVSETKVVGECFDTFANTVDFMILEPVIDNDGFVSIDNYRLFRLAGCHSTECYRLFAYNFSFLCCEIKDIHLLITVRNDDVLSLAITFMSHQSWRRSRTWSKSTPVHFRLLIVVFGTPLKSQLLGVTRPSDLVHVHGANDEDTSFTVKSKRISYHFSW